MNKIINTTLNFCKTHFTLTKYKYKSNQDYVVFKELILENFEYSTLQYYIPNIDRIDVKDKVELYKFFSIPEYDKYIKDFYDIVSNNQQKTEIGYYKATDSNNVFVGSVGWLIHDIKNAQINILERGIHLKKDFRSSDVLDKSTEKSNIPCAIMRLAVENLTENQNELNKEGQLISSILKTNVRSQKFTKKYELNVGEPKECGNVLRWESKISEFLDRSDKIKAKLDKDIVVKTKQHLYGI